MNNTNNNGKKQIVKANLETPEKKTKTPDFKTIMNKLHAYRSTIYLQTDTGTRQLTSAQYIRYIQDAAGEDMTPAQCEQALDARIVDAVYDRYAAAPRGRYQTRGRKILVINGVDWIDHSDTPSAPPASITEWLDAARRSTVLGILNAGLGDDRALWLAAWIAQARARVRQWLCDGSVTSQIPILVLAGKEGCGKSLILNRVLAPLINGWDGVDNAPARPVPAARPLLGHFNSEIIRSCLLSIDDELSGLSQRERERLFSMGKNLCYAGGVSIEGKGVTPVIESMPWAICICCNLSDNALKSIPYNADETNKLLALGVDRRGDLPPNYQCITRADVQEAAQLIDQLPVLLANDPCGRIIRDPLERQGVAGWIDPDLRAGLRAISPEGVVARTWLAIYQRANATEAEYMNNWLKVSSFHKLLTDCARAREVDDLRTACPTPRACGRLLKSLVDSGLGRTELDRHSKNPLYWLDLQRIKDEIDKAG